MKPKVLIVGDWLADIYEKAFFDGFVNSGYETEKFSWIQHFKYYQYATRFVTDGNRIKSFYYRFQNKFSVGPAVIKINRDLVAFCKKNNPALVFIYKGNHIYPDSIQRIRESGARVFGYNNDDPFSLVYPKYFWRHFKGSIPYYDHLFVFRPKNLRDYNEIGYNNCSLLRAYYIHSQNFCINRLENEKYVSDVSFIGHFEADGRDEYIKYCIDNQIFFKLYGTLWKNSKHYPFLKEKLGEIVPVYQDYNLAINSTKIALVFLSKLNNDSYTTRCFEIPATKTFMLSEYTDDLAGMFKEGIEAEYFRSKEEMIDKIRFYLKYDDKRKRIAEAGYERLMQDGHEVIDRVKEIMRVFDGYDKNLTERSFIQDAGGIC